MNYHKILQLFSSAHQFQVDHDAFDDEVYAPLCEVISLIDAELDLEDRESFHRVAHELKKLNIDLDIVAPLLDDATAQAAMKDQEKMNPFVSLLYYLGLRCGNQEVVDQAFTLLGYLSGHAFLSKVNGAIYKEEKAKRDQQR